uniref:Uncharacterized protein n=1 Tax=mine drainage metagenome TaxID=410659 RepID=E6QNT6_9ZZZZ
MSLTFAIYQWLNRSNFYSSAKKRRWLMAPRQGLSDGNCYIIAFKRIYNLECIDLSHALVAFRNYFDSYSNH